MALYTIRSGATSHPEDTVLQTLTDLIRSGGVLDLSSSNHLKATEKAGTPDRSVDVQIGRAILYKVGGNAYPVRNTAIVNVPLAVNSSGNPRIDAIVVYANLAASPSSDGTGVITVTKVQGTPSASPSAPSDSDIATVIGASNPFFRLANVTCNNGYSQIFNASIADTRTRYRTRNNNVLVDVPDAGTINFDQSAGNIFSTTLGGNRTLTVSNVEIGIPFMVRLKQDGGGNRTVTWFSGINWYGGTPVLTTTPAKTDVFAFMPVAAGVFDGFVVGQEG